MTAVRNQRPLHLLEVGLKWPPETFMQWKLEGLAARGFRVTVSSTRGRCDPNVRLRGVELLLVPSWDEPRAGKLVTALWNGLRLLLDDPRRLVALIKGVRRSLPSSHRRLLETFGEMSMFLPLARLRPDVVHLEWETAATKNLPLFDVWDCPIVTSCHGAGVNRQPHAANWSTRLGSGLPVVFRKATAVHCVAHAVAEEARRYGLDPAKARLIRTGVDPSYFRPDEDGEPQPDELRVVGVARLVWSKGHEYALQAIRHLVDEGIPARYELLGGEPHPGSGEATQLPRILSAIDDLDLRDSVHLRGQVSSSEVRDALRRADVFLHPSLSEGLPTVLLEAMACAVPVVASDCGGVTEAVTDGVEGFIVPRREPKKLAQAMARLWCDPPLRAAMGRAGRSRIESEFSLSEHLDNFAALYEELAAAPGAPRQ